MKKTIKLLLSKIGLYSVLLNLRKRFMQIASYPKWWSLQKQECIFLELGSGAKKGSDGWITVDILGADICHDLRKGIPLPNESVDRIYTSHMFEHIPYKELVVFINECYRVLKKGGELSVSVPNAGLYIGAYVKRARFRPAGEGYKPALIQTGSFMDQVNYIAYMGGHHNYMFDQENLINTLNSAPFKSVRLRDFDKNLDLKIRDFESIYAIALK